MASEGSSTGGLDLARLLALWQIDANTIRLLHEHRLVIQGALAGHEQEFVEGLLAHSAETAAGDDKARRREAVILSGLWHALLGGDLSEAQLERVAASGGRFLALGIDVRTFFAVCQRVMRRVVAALLAQAPIERDAAIDAVSRVVLLTVGVALAAHADSLAGQVSVREVHRETEQLQEQIKALEELAHVDPLTRLFNRRHFEETLVAEIARAERAGLPLSLVLADLDGFKPILARWGAAVGDLVLAHVAGLIRETARRSDILARSGRDLFALILPGTGVDNAVLFAERLRTVVRARPATLSDGGTVPVTIGLGVAGLEGNESARSLLARAEAALVRAKDRGADSVAQ